jgi:hypothetical protein
VDIPGAADVRAEVTRRGRFDIVTVIPKHFGPQPRPGHYKPKPGRGNGNGHGKGHGHGHNNAHCDATGTFGGTMYGTGTYGYSNTTGGNGWGQNGYVQETSYAYMSNEDFMRVKASVQGQSFSNNKMEVAKQAIAAKGASAAQVRELMSEFTFDSDKLELAKFAYNHTADKDNYFEVNNAFSFSSNVSALNQYIREFKA